MIRNTGIWIRIYPEFIQILPAPTSYFLTFVNKYCQNIATTNFFEFFSVLVRYDGFYAEKQYKNCITRRERYESAFGELPT